MTSLLQKTRFSFIRDILKCNKTTDLQNFSHYVTQIKYIKLNVMAKLRVVL